MILKKFGYWEILLLIFLNSILSMAAVAFNVPLFGAVGMILFLLMWITRSN